MNIILSMISKWILGKYGVIFFTQGKKGDKQIYEYTSKMSEKFENICSELENANDDIHDNVSNSVTRRAEKIEKNYQNIKKMEKKKII